MSSGAQANASAKRIAAQNERAIRNLRVGMIVCMGLSITIRLFLRRYTFSSILSIMVYVTTLAPSMLLYSFLVRAGTPRRNASGMLLSPGDDLNQPGLTDWSWDIIYVTWACQVGSSLFGEWVWWLYLVVSNLIHGLRMMHQGSTMLVDTFVCRLQGLDLLYLPNVARAFLGIGRWG
jgi:SRP-independent targeting protein 2/TMEM208